jgi:hypothetical protein
MKTSLKLCAARSALVLNVSLLTGCTTNEANWDAMKMRQHMNDYYEDEIMENLIRARNGRPFVHLDLSSQTASVGSTLTGTVGGGQTLNNTGTRVVTTSPSTHQVARGTAPTGPTTITTNLVGTAAGVAGTITRMATRPFTISVTPSRTDKIDVVTKAVLDNPDVYLQYIHFLNLEKSDDDLDDMSDTLDLKRRPVSLVMKPDGTKISPSQYVPGTLRKWEGAYYYVPVEFKQAYFDLCLNLMKRKAPPTTGNAPVIKELKDTSDKLDELRSKLP